MEQYADKLKVGYDTLGQPFFILFINKKLIYMWEDGQDDYLCEGWYKWKMSWELVPTTPTSPLTFLIITGKDFYSTELPKE